MNTKHDNKREAQVLTAWVLALRARCCASCSPNAQGTVVHATILGQKAEKRVLLYTKKFSFVMNTFSKMLPLPKIIDVSLCAVHFNGPFREPIRMLLFNMDQFSHLRRQVTVGGTKHLTLQVLNKLIHYAHIYYTFICEVNMFILFLLYLFYIPVTLNIFFCLIRQFLSIYLYIYCRPMHVTNGGYYHLPSMPHVKFE